jgi:hypothetical protein
MRLSALYEFISRVGPQLLALDIETKPSDDDLLASA